MFGLILIYPRAEAFLGVERQVITCFGRSTPDHDVFLAFNSRQQHVLGVQRQVTSSISKQSMDYYILMESSGCPLSNAVESAPFGVL
ncbi:uncharacterized protein DS421_10g295100 [Arachis hypogaea]|nr:uncharacterized protein DS421_10g295100 [Arachis hypogaea]